MHNYNTAIVKLRIYSVNVLGQLYIKYYKVKIFILECTNNFPVELKNKNTNHRTYVYVTFFFVVILRTYLKLVQAFCIDLYTLSTCHLIFMLNGLDRHGRTSEFRFTPSKNTRKNTRTHKPTHKMRVNFSHLNEETVSCRVIIERSCNFKCLYLLRYEIG
jgi:hypothetical protein